METYVYRPLLVVSAVCGDVAALPEGRVHETRDGIASIFARPYAVSVN